MRSAELRAAATRVAATRALGLGVFLILAARGAHLTVIDDQGHDLWGRQVYSRFELPPARGVVYDRRGSELAVSVSAPSVYAIASELDSSARRSLARALHTSESALDERLAGLGRDIDRYTGQPRGFGFVEMDDTEANTAVSATNGQEIGGRQLRVDEARPRREGGGGEGGGGGGYDRGDS